MNFSLLFFSSSTLRMQNSNVCGGKRGGVTSWKSSNPHFSYRANAGSSAQHSWQSVFSTGKPLMLFIVNLSLQQRRTRRGRWSLPWFAMFLHWCFSFFSTQKNFVVRWLKHHNKPSPVGVPLERDCSANINRWGNALFYHVTFGCIWKLL